MTSHKSVGVSTMHWKRSNIGQALIQLQHMHVAWETFLTLPRWDQHSRTLTTCGNLKKRCKKRQSAFTPEDLHDPWKERDYKGVGKYSLNHPRNQRETLFKWAVCKSKRLSPHQKPRVLHGDIGQRPVFIEKRPAHGSHFVRFHTNEAS